MGIRSRWISLCLELWKGVTRLLSNSLAVPYLLFHVTDIYLDIRPRSANHARILREEWDAAQKVGIEFEKHSIDFDKLILREEAE